MADWLVPTSPDVAADAETVVRIQGLRKTFICMLRRCCALDGIDLEVRRGEMVGLIGASGSGKSTLLRGLAGLLAADQDSGEVQVLDQSVQRGNRLAPGVRQLRRRIGFIFQQFNLVGRLDLLTNVMVGMLPRLPAWRAVSGRFTLAQRREAMAALARVGMHEMAAQRASTLSGGQQQRAAIARALVQGAEVILADEPIASLDPVSSAKVMDLLAEINRRDGVTVLVSLHQVEFARRYCPRIVAMRAGRIVFDGPGSGLTDARLRELYGAEADDAGLLDTTAALPPPPRPERHVAPPPAAVACGRIPLASPA